MNRVKTGSAQRPVGRTRCIQAVVVLLLVASSTVRPSGQSVTVYVAGDALHVRAPGSSFGFIQGATLERLRDGRAVRMNLELRVLAEHRQSVNLSYDLWEERFAVSLIGSPASVSHLIASDAEAWCLEQLTVPVATLGRLGRDTPLWIGLAYRVQDPDVAADPQSDRFTLRTLIELLSRRDEDDAVANAIEAGPFRLPG